MSKIVVFVEHADGTARRASLEALGAAKAAGSEVVAVVTGEGADAVGATLGAHGASQVVAIPGAGQSPDGLAADVAKVVQDQGAKALLAASSSGGRDLLPRAAALLDCSLFSDCTGLEAAGDGFRVTRPWLAGKLIASLETKDPVLVAGLRRNTFPVVEDGGAAEVITADATTDYKAVLKSIEAKANAKLDVTEAPIVVSGGRGLQAPEHFSILEDLANAFGNAAVGASRAVVDAGWRPHGEQVGQTGKTVAPGLYIAVGISGAIQHVAGMKTSKVIVAINKDADAPIFKLADYGIVGDAFEVVPKLTEAVAAARANG